MLDGQQGACSGNISQPGEEGIKKKLSCSRIDSLWVQAPQYKLLRVLGLDTLEQVRPDLAVVAVQTLHG